MIDWNIQTRAHACQQCGRPFADKTPYHTLLFDDKTGYTRRDVCEECWGREHLPESGKPPHCISHWQGVFEAPPPPTELIRKETAETLLQKLVELDESRYLPSMFILAVMLERKRLLKVKDQTRMNGRRYLVYEHPKTGAVFTIADPELGIDQLEEVQRSVSHLLEHGLTEEPPPETAAVRSDPTPETFPPNPGSSTDVDTAESDGAQRG